MTPYSIPGLVWGDIFLTLFSKYWLDFGDLLITSNNSFGFPCGSVLRSSIFCSDPLLVSCFQRWESACLCCHRSMWPAFFKDKGMRSRCLSNVYNVISTCCNERKCPQLKAFLSSNLIILYLKYLLVYAFCAFSQLYDFLLNIMDRLVFSKKDLLKSKQNI